MVRHIRERLAAMRKPAWIIDDWRAYLTRAWSSQILFFWTLTGVLYANLQFLQDYVSKTTFAWVSVVICVLAIIAKFTKQKGFD